MNIMRIYSISAVATGLTFVALGCATSEVAEPEFRKTEVVERMGDLSKTPEWATGAVAMLEEGSRLVFVNTVSMSADARVEACTKAAEETGRANMQRYIKENFTTSGQVAELSSANDPGVESLLAFLSQGQMAGVMVRERYWEKRVESTATGNRQLRIHCAAKVAIEKRELDRQMREAIGGVPAGNPQVREKLLNAQKDFIENIGRQQAGK